MFHCVRTTQKKKETLHNLNKATEMYKEIVQQMPTHKMAIKQSETVMIATGSYPRIEDIDYGKTYIL